MNNKTAGEPLAVRRYHAKIIQIGVTRIQQKAKDLHLKTAERMLLLAMIDADGLAGVRFKAALAKTGLSQNKLSRLIGKADNYITRVLGGKTRIGMETLFKVEQLSGISAVYVLAGQGPMIVESWATQT